MNKLSMMLTASAAMLCLAPVVASAASSDPLAEKCFKAFETKLSQKFTPAPRVQDTHLLSWSPSTPGLDQASVVEYKMTATNPKNHQAVLSASCLVNSAGSVISLTETVPGAL